MENSPVILYNYLCTNEACSCHFTLIKKTEEERDCEELCAECLQPMKLMGEVIHGGIGGKFRQSTPAQRKEMLLKRSSEHFKRSGLADRKKHLEQTYKEQAREHFKR